MLDTVLGWLVIVLPFVLSAIFIFIPSKSEDSAMNINWRILLVVCMALYGMLVLYQQKRSSAAAQRDQAKLQTRFDSLEAHIGALNSNAPTTPPPTLVVPKVNPPGSGKPGQTLALLIDGANISVPESPPNSTQLALITAVHNLASESSVATDYELSVSTPNHVVHKAVFIRLGNKGELRWKSASGVVTVIPASDALEDKTENHEIISGGIVRGQLLFLLPGVPHDQVIDPETILILSAKDAQGNRCTVKETIEEISKK